MQSLSNNNSKKFEQGHDSPDFRNATQDTYPDGTYSSPRESRDAKNITENSGLFQENF